MWLLLSFVSATMLGFYDTSKKAALKDNAVLPVLLLNTMFSTLIFSPFIADSILGTGMFEGTPFSTRPYKEPAWAATAAQEGYMLKAHMLIILKSFIVLTSWIAGYFGLKHLPITIVGPINATRPILVLVGAMLFFGERLNGFQWAGVLLAILSLFLMSITGKKEHIDFRHNNWIWCIGVATIAGAASGLYDKYIMRELSPMFVQSWFNLYQLVIMSIVCLLLWYPSRHKTTPFRWSMAIPLISLFITAADFAYYNALSDPDAMISVVSLVRRGSVLISFTCGVLLFKERNIKGKLLDLALILAGMVFIWLGSR